MKILFLAARHYAQSDNRKIVKMKDVLIASTAVYFKNHEIINSLPLDNFDNITDQFFSFYEVDEVATGLHSNEIRNKIDNYDIANIKYEKSVRDLINTLKKKGFELTTQKHIFF